jgi:peptidoglycan-associated lipoprotein
MKTKSFGVLLLVVALGLSLAGCGCFQQAMRGETAPPPTPEQKKIVAPEDKKEMVVGKEEAAPAPGAVAPAAPPAPPAPPAAEVVTPGLADINFDFDKDAIRPGDAEILKKNYPWFTSNSGRVRIEGNCDERGTVEYNLVLGQKRADATKSYMVNLGVDAKRLDTISYGKEKPIDPGHNEEAWAKNRRAHFTPLQ